MSIAEKKKKVLKYVVESITGIDPNGDNVKRYTSMFNAMTDKEFHQFMVNMRDGKWEFHLVIPNMTKKTSPAKVVVTAKKVGCQLFHRLWLTDSGTGRKYLTRSKHVVLKLPVRRMQQYLDKKLSVSESDTSIDGLTGQVTGNDRSSSITNPEIQALNSKGLNKTLSELVTVRGGDIGSYGEFKRQLEEQGDVRLSSLESNTISRTAKVTEILLEGMHIESNLTGE